jgi:hypothetical protein
MFKAVKYFPLTALNIFERVLIIFPTLFVGKILVNCILAGKADKSIEQFVCLNF